LSYTCVSRIDMMEGPDSQEVISEPLIFFRINRRRTTHEKFYG